MKVYQLNKLISYQMKCLIAFIFKPKHVSKFVFSDYSLFLRVNAFVPDISIVSSFTTKNYYWTSDMESTKQKSLNHFIQIQKIIKNYSAFILNFHHLKQLKWTIFGNENQKIISEYNQRFEAHFEWRKSPLNRKLAFLWRRLFSPSIFQIHHIFRWQL